MGSWRIYCILQAVKSFVYRTSSTYRNIWVRYIWARDTYNVYDKQSSHLYTASHLHTVTYGFVTYGFVTHIMYMTSSQVMCIPQVIYIPPAAPTKSSTNSLELYMMYKLYLSHLHTAWSYIWYTISIWVMYIPPVAIYDIQVVFESCTYRLELYMIYK